MSIQEILAAECLNEWGYLDKKHCQPKQCLQRTAKWIKVIDGLSDINPEDKDDDKYQTDMADSISESEANNMSDDDISNREVSVRLSIIFAFPLISIWISQHAMKQSFLIQSTNWKSISRSSTRISRSVIHLDGRGANARIGPTCTALCYDLGPIFHFSAHLPLFQIM